MFPSNFINLLPLALLFSRFITVLGEELPTVRLDQATVYGITKGAVTSFFNIPFAEPPYALAPPSESMYPTKANNYFRRVGNLRLRRPKPINAYTGTINATQIGPQCIQQLLPLRQDMPAEMLSDMITAMSASPTPPREENEDCRFQQRLRLGQWADGSQSGESLKYRPQS